MSQQTLHHVANTPFDKFPADFSLTFNPLSLWGRGEGVKTGYEFIKQSSNPSPTIQAASFTHCPLCDGKNFSLKYELSPLKVCQCPDCSVMFRNPYTPPSEMAAIYSTRQSMEGVNPRLATYYDGLAGSKTERFFDRCLEKLDRLKPGGSRSILDLGCGNGYFLWRAKRRGWAVKGIEPSEEAGRNAWEKFQIEVSRINFEAYENPERFDCVSLWDFIEHVPNPRELLRKAHSLLKPDGILLVATPDHFSLIDFLADLTYRSSFTLFRKPLELLFVPEHTLYFTDSTLRRVVEEGGFEITEVVKTGTDIDRFQTGALFNAAAKVALTFSRWLHWENRIILFAKKRDDVEP